MLLLFADLVNLGIHTLDVSLIFLGDVGVGSEVGGGIVVEAKGLDWDCGGFEVGADVETFHAEQKKKLELIYN